MCESSTIHLPLIRQTILPATAFVAMILATALTIAAAARADEPYFPDLVFDSDKEDNDSIVDDDSKYLKAMKEPSLWKLSQNDHSATVYRFLWLPTFDHPVSVRLVKSGKDVTLYAVLLDGRGGYEPGKIVVSKTAKLSNEQWAEYQRRLDKVNPWKMPTQKDEIGGLDGDMLMLECVAQGKYHVVDRWSPEHDDDYARLCRDMLILSGLDVMKTWKSYRE